MNFFFLLLLNLLAIPLAPKIKISGKKSKSPHICQKILLLITKRHVFREFKCFVLFCFVFLFLHQVSSFFFLFMLLIIHVFVDSV